MIGGNVAVPVAAAAARARRRVKARFVDAGAVSARQAIAAEKGRRMERRYFDDLEAYGAIVRTSDGLYYLDEAKLRDHDTRRRKRALAIVGSLIAATAAAAAFLR